MNEIPTVAEFLTSKDIIYDNDHPGTNSATVVRIGKYVMKYNGRTCLEEADNLNYIAAHTNVPVPWCYASGILPLRDGGRKYLIMDFVEGDTLEQLWPNLSRVDKDHILQQLHGYVAEYRNLAPPDYLGAVVKGPPGDAFFTIFDADPALGGPFRDAPHFKEALLTRLGLGLNGESSNLVALVKMQLNDVLKDFRTVFTHTDLAPKNILVHRQGTNEDGSGAFKVTIIDWETAGWYPEWWEW